MDNYWIRALPNVGTTTFDGGVNSAILRYSGADAIEPTTTQTTSVLALNETDLVPLENLAAPGTAEVGGVDYALNLVTSFVSLFPLCVNLGSSRARAERQLLRQRRPVHLTLGPRPAPAHERR